MLTPANNDGFSLYWSIWSFLFLHWLQYDSIILLEMKSAPDRSSLAKLSGWCIPYHIYIYIYIGVMRGFMLGFLMVPQLWGMYAPPRPITPMIFDGCWTPRKEILEEETLPRRYAGLSTCFRLVLFLYWPLGHGWWRFNCTTFGRKGVPSSKTKSTLKIATRFII